MKKCKKIILLLLFILTLNVNNLGMIDKKVVVTSKEYKEGNTRNLVLNKILSDNELQEEKENMFNYASNGSYISSVDPETGLQYGNNPSQVTNGLYSMEDEDGISYYYRGNIDNNNIQFGEYESDYYVYGINENYFQTKESCMSVSANEEWCQPLKLASTGDKMYWKIVRVNGDGSLRLIYNGTSTNSINNDLASSYAVGYSTYNFEKNNPKYAGYTYDRDTNETNSFIKKEVDAWYSNTLGSSSYDSKVIEGRFCSDSSGYKMVGNYNFRNVYYYIFSSYDRLGQANNNFAKPNSPTLKCPSTTESYGGSYRLKAGLITADELVLAGESASVVGNSYLSLGESEMYYWSMTPAAFINYSVNIWNESELLIFDIPNNSYAIRPVINVSVENTTLKGEGTKDNPYVLEEVNANSHRGVITIEEGSSEDVNIAFREELDLSKVTWTSEDESIAIIENGKIRGLKEGQTIIQV